MDSLTALILSLALLGIAPSATGGETARNAREPEQAPAMSMQRMPGAFVTMESFTVPPVQGQVRIEQRVIIRIAPSSPAVREEMLARLPRRDIATQFHEVKDDRCMPLSSIAGVAPVQPNRLLLFMRDRRILSASLDRACDAQAFYSGFYVERSEDGMMCAGRDMLKSRAGASCEVAQFNRLVAVRD